MSTSTYSHFANEWQLLQNQFDSYEKYSLIIKLGHLFVFALCLIENAQTSLLVLISALFWLQDAVWKTFQSRIENRILILEEAMQSQQQATDSKEETATIGNSAAVAYQFNRQFLLNRPSHIGLIAEYAKQALKPTIALPHLPILIIQLCVLL